MPTSVYSLTLSSSPSAHAEKQLETPPAHPRVRLLSITVRMRPTSGVTLGVVKAASHILERFGGKGGARSHVGDKHEGDDATGNGAALWASLARYDDALVDTLERWERWSRDAASAGGMGKLRAGGDVMHGEAEGTYGEERLRNLFVGDKWDGKKMVRSFARMRAGSGAEKVREGKGKGKKLIVQTLRAHESVSGVNVGGEGEEEEGVVLDAFREVRIKLYMGQVSLITSFIR